MEFDRIAINRENAQKSTGPKTDEGKERSSQNSFKHGLYSKALVLPTESAKDLQDLRDAIIAEHQPVNVTETLLVDELIQNAWRIRRFRLREISAIDAFHCPGGHDYKLMALVERALASAQRAFHRALASLTKLQKERGFVPGKTSQPAPEPVRHAAAAGFVPENPPLASHLNQSTGQSSVASFHKIARSAPSEA